MGSKLKLGRCRFNGGAEQEPGQHRHVLRRCLASVIAVSLSTVCMVPAAYAQDVDDVNGSSNSVILGGEDNTVVAAPSARNVNVDDKTSEEGNTSNGAPAPSETNQARSKIHLLHLPLPVVLPNPQMVRQATRRMPQQGLLLAIPLMTEPKRRLRLILLLKMPRTILRLRRINRRRRPMCRSPRRRLAAVTLKARSPRKSTARPTS